MIWRPPDGEVRNIRFSFRLRKDEAEKFEALCKAANREASTVLRFLINDAHYRAVKKGAIATDETET